MRLGLFRSRVSREWLVPLLLPALAVRLLLPEGFMPAFVAGGMSMQFDGQEVTILGPGAPLRAKLTGQKAGKKLKEPSLKIKSVC